MIRDPQIANVAGSISDLSNKLGVTNIVQTSVTAASTVSASSLTWYDVPSLSVSITPSSTSKKVLVMISLNYAPAYIDGTFLPTAPSFRLLRGSTSISIGDSAGSRTRVSFSDGNDGIWTDFNFSAYLVYMYEPTKYSPKTINFVFLDSPNTASSTTYKVQYRDALIGGVVYFNRGSDNVDGDYVSRASSNIIAMEVG